MKNLLMMIGSLLLLSGVSIQAGDISSSFPNESKVLFKVQLDKLRKVKALKGIVHNEKLEGFQTQIELFTGLDFDAISTVWVGVIKDKEAVLVFEGDFNTSNIVDTMDSHGHFKTVKKKGVLFAVNIPDEKTGKINLAAVINTRTIVIGSPKNARVFLDSYLGNTQGLDQLKKQKAAQLNGSNQLFHGVLLESKFPGKDNPVTKNLKGAELMISFDSKMQVSLKADLTSERFLKPMQKLLEGFIGIAETIHTPKIPALLKKEVLGNAKVNVENNSLLVTSSLSSETVEEIIEDKFSKVHE
jgi:hypothetical protein